MPVHAGRRDRHQDLARPGGGAVDVVDLPGPVLLVCTAPEGSADAERLQMLAQLTTAASR
jgi:hypothetical protein